jgi:hypothetical protein
MILKTTHHLLANPQYSRAARRESLENFMSRSRMSDCNVPEAVHWCILHAALIASARRARGGPASTCHAHGHAHAAMAPCMARHQHSSFAWKSKMLSTTHKHNMEL